ncbi:unnamed protein product [Amoebophrya sp. A25]|nr:unnamed protein product [Amoebophrya sp. A25]|eukprot:GSA25T00022188001.1
MGGRLLGDYSVVVHTDTRLVLIFRNSIVPMSFCRNCSPQNKNLNAFSSRSSCITEYAIEETNMYTDEYTNELAMYQYERELE